MTGRNRKTFLFLNVLMSRVYR